MMKEWSDVNTYANWKRYVVWGHTVMDLGDVASINKRPEALNLAIPIKTFWLKRNAERLADKLNATILQKPAGNWS
jgi:hypothetical protein